MDGDTNANGLKPTVRRSVGDETEYEHPAYAQLSVSRVTGGAYLYGADYEVGEYLAIRVSTSAAYRRLSTFRHREKERVVEVLVSPAQWAAFVSGVNLGTGVCATMTRRGGDRVPPIIPPEDEKDLFAEDVDRTIEDGNLALDELAAALEGLKLSAAVKKDLGYKVEWARRSIGSSQDFIRSRFGEFVHERTERMKANLHAYAESVLVGLGLRAAREEIEAATSTVRIEDRGAD